MARFDTSGIDEIIQAMTSMGQNVGPVAEQMVNAAAEEIKTSWQETARSRGLHDTGAMIDSIGYGGTAPQRLGDIYYKDIYPQGKDGKGVRNAEKDFILHYGKSTYPATYWVDEADEKSAAPVQARLEQIWDRFLQVL